MSDNEQIMGQTAKFSSGALDALFMPRVVAVIGASADPARIGGRPIAYMRRQGFAGTILPVNPNRAEVQGLRAYPSIADLPQTPDAAIIAVPGAAVIDAVAELGARGTKAAIIFSAGFAETGPEGAALQQRLVETARQFGMRLLGPNSLGMFNARIGFFASFTSSLESGFPLPGRIGIVSQSGAYATHLFACARNRGMGTPLCVTTGNEADLTVGEITRWMVDDPETDVIAIYAEGIRDGAGFISALEAARRARKPVVVMKVGRSARGQAAAQSHTAAIAGDDAVTGAVIADCGAIRARTTEEMLDIAYLATRRIYPARNTLGMITVSGGAGVLVSDVAEMQGLDMPVMPPAAQARLKALLPFASPVNPVDCTAHVFNDMSLVGQFTETMVQEGGYSSVLAFFSQVGAAPSVAPKLLAELKAVRQRHPDRLYVLSVVADAARVAQYEAEGFAVFEDPTRATIAIDAMGRFGAAFARGDGLALPAVPRLALPARQPDEAEAKRVLAAIGIAAPPEEICTSAAAAAAAAARIGFPVVMKIVSADILHKSEIGGVLLNIADADAAAAGFETLMARAQAAMPQARREGVLVVKQMQGGVECIIGIHRDPVFGPVAMFGLGGVFVEVLRDVVLRLCPFGEAEAEAMIRAIKGLPLLTGARGRPPADIKALAAALARLSVFAHEAGPRLRAIEINPIIAMPEGKGAFALDAVIELETET
jgi:acyl-CoA synthetase (NDP forming)